MTDLTVKDLPKRANESKAGHKTKHVPKGAGCSMDYVSGYPKYIFDIIATLVPDTGGKWTFTTGEFRRMAGTTGRLPVSAYTLFRWIVRRGEGHSTKGKKQEPPVKLIVQKRMGLYELTPKGIKLIQKLQAENNSASAHPSKMTSTRKRSQSK
jgi:hypothetical protein